MTEEYNKTDSEEGRSLQTITRGISIFFIGNLISNSLKFAFNLILTRVLGATLYGIYTYSNTIIHFFVLFARLGTGKSLLRFLPASSANPAQQNWVTSLAYLTALLGSISMGVTLFVLAPVITRFTLEKPLLVDVLRILAIVLPFNTLTNITTTVFRALEKVEYQIIVSNIFKPIIQILVVLSAFTLGYSLIGAVAALAIGTILTFSIAVTLLHLRTDIRPLGDRSRGSVSEFYNFSIPLTFKDVGSTLYTHIDILMIGFFLTGSAVGIYRVSFIIAALLLLPLSASNQLFPPVASGLYTAGKMDELESVYKIITRWVFTVVIPPAIAIIIYSSEVLRIFGEEFTGGAFVLIFFTIAQLTNCAVGPSGFLLMMTDHQYLNLINQWTLGVLNAILNYIFILEFGLIGAAVATAGTLAFINIVRVTEVWYFEQMTPYTSKYWKPIVAGICGVPAMIGWKLFLTGYPLLMIGSATGWLVFAGALFIFGIEREDQEFYAENIKSRLE